MVVRCGFSGFRSGVFLLAVLLLGDPATSLAQVTVRSVEPTLVELGSETTFTIRGTGFHPSSTVRFDDDPALDVEVRSITVDESGTIIVCVATFLSFTPGADVCVTCGSDPGAVLPGAVECRTASIDDVYGIIRDDLRHLATDFGTIEGVERHAAQASTQMSMSQHELSVGSVRGAIRQIENARTRLDSLLEFTRRRDSLTPALQAAVAVITGRMALLWDILFDLIFLPVKKDWEVLIEHTFLGPLVRIEKGSFAIVEDGSQRGRVTGIVVTPPEPRKGNSSMFFLEPEPPRQVGTTRIQAYFGGVTSLAGRSTLYPEPNDNGLYFGVGATFVLQGCDAPRFIQIKKLYIRIEKPDQDPEVVQDEDFGLDGTTSDNPDARAVGSLGASGLVMFDLPSFYYPDGFTLPDGTKVSVREEFKTYVICGDRLLGVYEWSVTVSFESTGEKDAPRVKDESASPGEAKWIPSPDDKGPADPAFTDAKNTLNALIDKDVE